MYFKPHTLTIYELGGGEERGKQSNLHPPIELTSFIGSAAQYSKNHMQKENLLFLSQVLHLSLS